MIASALIKEDVLPLQVTDTVEDALFRMNEYKSTHFPVCEEGKLIGLLMEKELIGLKKNSTLKKEKVHIEPYFVKDYQNLYDVVGFASDKSLTIIPVNDDSGGYIGSITQRNLIDFFADSLSVNSRGAVIILEVSDNDYSLTEISNIIESNDSKILSTFIISKPDSTKIDVVIKLSKLDLRAIIQTFERYKYKIIASYQENYDYEELRENYDSLMNYLKI